MSLHKSKLKLQDVKELGGSEEDLNFLDDVDDNSDMEIMDKFPESSEPDELGQEEILAFMKKLKGFSSKENKGIGSNEAKKTARSANQKEVFNHLPVKEKPKDEYASLKEEAEKVFANVSNGKSFDRRKGWLNTLARSGTAHDRLAALTLQVQEDPKSNSQSLDALISLVGKKSRREALQALDVVKTLWLTSLLPARKLIPFNQRSLEDLPMKSKKAAAKEATSTNPSFRSKRDQVLLEWLHEDKLKQQYSAFLNHVSSILQDQLIDPKKAALSAVFDLIATKPEQEIRLLNMLINKLGDPDNKVSTQATRLLLKLLEQHPNMKVEVVSEVEQFLFRPNLKPRAQFNSICLLGQIDLNPTDTVVASKMIDIYFSFFKVYTQKSPEEKKKKKKKGKNKKSEEKAPRVDDNKVLRVILSSVNRAVKYAKVDIGKLKDKVDSIFKVIHTVDFNTSVQALMLVLHITETSTELTDRYFQALYRKMLDPAVRTSSRQNLFLHLLLRSLKKDPVQERVKALIKRLLQLCLQVSAPTFVCGSLLLLSALLQDRPGLLTLEQSGSNVAVIQDEDGEEHFEDVKDEDVEMEDEPPLNSTGSRHHTKQSAKSQGVLSNHISRSPQSVQSSWVHRQNLKHGPKSPSGDYDPSARNPLFSNVSGTCDFELQRLCHHFHPTVVLFASKLLQGENIEYNGDPLEDFTLMRFLDRFSYKNPKKVKQVSGDKKDSLAVLPNTASYLALPEQRIPENEKFLHKYFKEQKEMLDFASEMKNAKVSEEKKKKKEGDDESSEDEGLSDDDSEEDFEDEADVKDDEEMSFQITAKDMGLESDDGTSDDDFSDSDEELEEDEPTHTGKKSMKLGADLMRSADEFSEYIDATSDLQMTYATTDNASEKQLKWEAQRDWEHRDSKKSSTKKPVKRLQKNRPFKKDQSKGRKFKR